MAARTADLAHAPVPAERENADCEAGRAKPASNGVVFAILLIASFFRVLDQCVWETEERHDFRSFYVAALAVERGENPYDVEQLNRLGRERGFKNYVYPYVYPPLLASTLGPVTRGFSFFAIQHLWTLASIMAIAVSLFLSLRTADDVLQGGALPPGQRHPWTAALVVLALLNLQLFPVKSVVWLGQVDYFITGLLAACIWSDRRGKASWTGVFLAIAVLIKSTPVVLVVPFVLRGSYCTLRWFVGSVLLFLLVSVMAGGIGPWVAFAQFLPHARPGVVIPGLFPPNEYPTFSTASFVARLFGGDLKAAEVIVPPLTIGLLWFVTETSRRARGSFAAQLQNLMFLISAVLVSPVIYMNHLNYILPGAFILQAYYLKHGRFMRLCGLILLLMLMGIEFPLLYEPMKLGTIGQRVFTSLNLYALVALLALCASELRVLKKVTSLQPAGEEDQ